MKRKSQIFQKNNTCQIIDNYEKHILDNEMNAIEMNIITLYQLAQKYSMIEKIDMSARVKGLGMRF